MAEDLKIWGVGGHSLISMIERELTDLPRSGKGEGACVPSSSAIPACSNRWLTGLTSLALFMLFAFFIIGEDFTPLACIFLPYGPLLQEPPSPRTAHTVSICCLSNDECWVWVGVGLSLTHHLAEGNFA